MSAVSGQVVKKRFFSGSTVALTVILDLEPGHGTGYTVGSHLALARLSEDAPKTYGSQARSLFASGFFENPKVLAAIGSDDQFNAWVRSMPSVFSGKRGTDSDPIEAAHVRTVADGSGVGVKNQYATIPLLRSEHRAQHDHGYSAIGGKEKAISWRSKMRQRWAKECIRYRLGGFQSFAQIPPAYFAYWCKARGIDQYLPKQYKEAING